MKPPLRPPPDIPSGCTPGVPAPVPADVPTLPVAMADQVGPPTAADDGLGRILSKWSQFPFAYIILSSPATRSPTPPLATLSSMAMCRGPVAAMPRSTLASKDRAWRDAFVLALAYALSCRRALALDGVTSHCTPTKCTTFPSGSRSGATKRSFQNGVPSRR